MLNTTEQRRHYMTSVHKSYRMHKDSLQLSYMQLPKYNGKQLQADEAVGICFF